MPCKKTVMILLLSSLVLSGCSRDVYPSSPTLSKLGPNMQDMMHEALGLNGSLTMPPSAKPTEASVSDLNHI